MSQQSFADLGVPMRSCAPYGARGTAPFDVQRSVVPDALAGHDLLVSRRPGRARPRLRRPAGGAGSGRGARPLPSCSCRRGSWRAMWRTTSATWRHGRSRWRPSTAGRNRAPGQARPEGAHPGGHARPHRGPRARGDPTDSVRVLVLDEADRMLDLGFRPAVDRIVALTPAGARPCSSLRRSRARRVRSPPPTPAAALPSAAFQRGARASVEHPFIAVATNRVASLVTSSPPASAAARSSSCAPSAGPTGSSSASQATASTPWRSTATARRPSARRRSVACIRGRSTLSWPPTWRPAGSTSDVTHAMTSTRPRTATPTSTASAARAERGRRVGITLVTREQSTVVSRSPDLRLHAQFEQSGMSAAGGRTHDGREAAAPAGALGGRGGGSPRYLVLRARPCRSRRGRRSAPARRPPCRAGSGAHDRAHVALVDQPADGRADLRVQVRLPSRRRPSRRRRPRCCSTAAGLTTPRGSSPR